MPSAAPLAAGTPWEKLITEGMSPAWSCPPAASLAERMLGFAGCDVVRWLISAMGSLGTTVPPGKAEGGREKDICEMLEASLHPAASLLEAGMQQERWREVSLTLGNAGVAVRWLTQNIQVQPQNHSPVSGMGGSCHCHSFLGLAS